MKIIYLQILSLSVFFVSCKPSEILPGFRLYEAPNAIDKPGRIYRLDPTMKTDYLVEYLPVNPAPQQIIIPTKERSKTMKIGVLVDFISQAETVIGANVGYNGDKKGTFNFKLDNAKIYKLSDEDLRTMYPQMLARIKSDIALFNLQKPKYFLVREAITATEIFIQSAKDAKNDAKLKANLEELIKLNGNVSWSNSKKDEIKVSLKEGLFVFYKAEEIRLQTSAAGDVQLTVGQASTEDLEKLKIGLKN